MENDYTKRIFGFIIFLLLGNLILAQTQLVLQNPGKFRRDEIKPGQTIGLQLKGMDQMYIGTLQKVNAEWIYIFGDSIKPDSIAKVRIAKSSFFPNMIRGAAFTGMIVYPLMIVINTPKDAWAFKKQGVQIGSILAGGYLLQQFMKLFYWRKIDLQRGKWQLRLMPTVDSY